MKKLLIAILVLAAIPAFAQRRGFGALKSGVGLTLDNYLTGDNTFSGTTVFTGGVGINRSPISATVTLDVSVSGSSNAFLGIAATGTGAASFMLDASNGDFSGGDGFTFKQDNSLNGFIEMGVNGGPIKITTLGDDDIYFAPKNVALLYFDAGNEKIGLGHTVTKPQSLISIYDANARLSLTDTDVNTVRNSTTQAADTSAVDIDVSGGEPIMQLATSTGETFRFIVFADTLCAVKISSTDTVRVVPSR